MLRDLAVLVGAPFVFAVGVTVWLASWRSSLVADTTAPDLTAAPTYAAPDGDVFAVAEGRWDWGAGAASCADELHEIRFSEDRAVMTIVHAPLHDSAGAGAQHWEYDIVSADTSRIRGTLRGERRPSAAVPVVWELVLMSPDVFRWRKAEWGPQGFTKEIRRCASPVSTPLPGPGPG